MGLKGHDEDYNRRCVSWVTLLNTQANSFSVSSNFTCMNIYQFSALITAKIGLWGKDDSKGTSYCLRLVSSLYLLQIKNEIPFFKKFENGGPIHEIARTYLSNEQTRQRVDLDAEDEAYEDPDAEPLVKQKEQSYTFHKRQGGMSSTPKTPNSWRQPWHSIILQGFYMIIWGWRWNG
jgi:hypothetical protein